MKGGRTTEGLEDTYLGVKLELTEGTPKSRFLPVFALIFGYSFPTGASELTADAIQPELKFCMAWELTGSTGLGVNLNAASLVFIDDRISQFSGSLSVATAISEMIGGYNEYFGFVEKHDYSPNTSFLNGGFSVLANENAQFDIRVGIGMNTVSPDYFVGLGFTRRL